MSPEDCIIEGLSEAALELILAIREGRPTEQLIADLEHEIPSYHSEGFVSRYDL